VWLNLSPLEPISADPATHAVDFANRWVHRLVNFVEGPMHRMDIPEHQIASSDHNHGVAWRTYFPQEVNGNGAGGEGGSMAIAAC